MKTNTQSALASVSSGEKNSPAVDADHTWAVDIEQRPVSNAYLLNRNVRHLIFRGITVTVKDKQTKQPHAILDNIDGVVNAGRYICFLYSQQSTLCRLADLYFQARYVQSWVQVVAGRQRFSMSLPADLQLLEHRSRVEL